MVIPSLPSLFRNYPLAEMPDDFAHSMITVINTVFRLCGRFNIICLPQLPLHLVYCFHKFVYFFRRMIPGFFSSWPSG